MSSRKATAASELQALLKSLRLSVVHDELTNRLIAADLGSAIATIAEVFTMELEARHDRKVARLRRASKLPEGKTFETFDSSRLAKAVVRKLDELRCGDFVNDGTNVLAFGLPGVGKSHALAALGHEVVAQGKSVFWTPTYNIVQDLLAAKRDLGLPRMLRKLDNFDLIILDDIGYVKQSSEEAEVLFTLLAERYERRATAITSNLMFSEWDRIFKNKMATSAAIDRLVHHSVVLELEVSSYRMKTAKTQGRKNG